MLNGKSIASAHNRNEPKQDEGTLMVPFNITTEPIKVVAHDEGDTPASAIERLKRESQRGKARPAKKPQKLSLSDITEEPAVFQMRDGGTDAARAKQIGKGLGSKTDERVHVWWSGERWIVIDGHHRIEGYRSSKAATFKVPVEAYVGMTLGEAIGWATQINAREKVPISREEKANGAWRVVLQGDGTVPQQAGWSGVSPAQINIMRKVRRVLLERGVTIAVMMVQGWDWSRRIEKEQSESDWSEDVQNAKAQEWAQIITKALGGQATKDPDSLSLAIKYMTSDGSLLERMVQGDRFEDAFGKSLVNAGWGLPDIPDEEQDDIEEDRESDF